MLVVSRKIGESIVIGDNITVVIRNLAKGKVSIGIEAPEAIPIYREELLNQKDSNDGVGTSKQLRSTPRRPGLTGRGNSAATA